MKLCYLDAFSGISGDMTVGALVDAGADQAALCSALDSLGTGAHFRVEKTKRKGIAASKFIVEGTDSRKHRHLHHIIELIDKSDLPSKARADAKLVFQRLAEAEAKVHGSPVERVHFHEVGAVDSIADVCGACVGFALLGVEAIVTSAVNVGGGTAKTEHGVLPVPTPATALLLAGHPIYTRGPAVELTTPTGAAIATALSRQFGPLPPMSVDRIGYGAGDRDFDEHANVLRVLVGEGSGAAESATVAVIEANIDDSTPEVLGYAMEQLLDAGALDATLEPILMKKNRPGSLLRVIAAPEDQERLAALVLAETSTLGLRVYTAERRVKARSFVEVDTPHGRVRVKVAGDGSFAPEYEDCRQLARKAGVPLKHILAAATQEYLNHAK
jgi:hypothetical protein